MKRKTVTMVTKGGLHIVSNGKLTKECSSLTEAILYAVKLRY